METIDVATNLSVSGVGSDNHILPCLCTRVHGDESGSARSVHCSCPSLLSCLVLAQETSHCRDQKEALSFPRDSTMASMPALPDVRVGTAGFCVYDKSTCLFVPYILK